MNKLKGILEDVKPSLSHTHVSMGNVKGRFYLPSSADSIFYPIYNKLVRDNIRICLAEQPGKETCIIGDIDLKINNVSTKFWKSNHKIYTPDMIDTYAKLFRETLLEKVENLNKDELICVILEKPIQINHSEHTLKNGFHLQFPRIVLTQEDISRKIIPGVKDKLKNVKLPTPFRFMDQIHDKNLANTLDDVSSKHWLMYGSSKDEKSLPYIATRVLDGEGKEITFLEAFKNYVTASGEQLLNEDDVKFNLPYLLTLTTYTNNSKNRKRYNLKLVEKIIPVTTMPRKRRETDDSSLSEEPNILKITQLLNLLDISRCENYSEWWLVGAILYNIGNNEDEEDTMLDLWKEWSSKSEKYDETTCDRIWFQYEKSNSKNKATIASLYYMAKNDNPNGYNKFRQQYDGKLDTKSMTSEESLKYVRSIDIPINDYDLAEMFSKFTDNHYITGKNGWYKFNGVIWQQLEEPGRFLRHDFAKMAKEFEQLAIKLSKMKTKKQKKDNEEEETFNGYNTLNDLITFKCMEINKAIKKLKNNTSVNALIHTLDSFFGKDNLDDIMDNDPYLIAFKNGVYNLKTHQFRQGLPDDFLSKSLKVSYKQWNKNDIKVKEMLNFFEKIFPDDKLREYFFHQTSKSFIGGNHDKIAMIWTGTGNNGKSVTQSLFEKMYGELSIKLPKSVITDYNVKSGACFPELVRVQGGIRWSVIDELSMEESIHAGSIKLLTGNDTLYARDIHQKGKGLKEIHPMFKLVLICNSIPIFKVIDQTAIERIRVIPFETTFETELPLNEDGTKLTHEQCKKRKIFLRDRNINDKLAGMAEVFAWYLLECLKEDKDIKIPIKVIRSTGDYKSRCDAVTNWTEDTIERTDDKTDYITFDAMYCNFKEWYGENYPCKNILLKKEFDILMAKYFGCTVKTKKVVGFRWIPIDDINKTFYSPK
ncbi:hypothetical protein AGMMS49579_03950 [Spirochaetia bacterium]|nr:hypothetical protein AGMMS49579_03950 [Spirochaetia bacterium]